MSNITDKIRLGMLNSLKIVAQLVRLNTFTLISMGNSQCLLNTTISILSIWGDKLSVNLTNCIAVTQCWKQYRRGFENQKYI